MEYEEALNRILRQKVMKLENALHDAEVKAETALEEKRRELQIHLSKVERDNKLQIWTKEARIHNLEVKKKTLQREVAKEKKEEANLERKVLLAEMSLTRSKMNLSPLKRKVEKAWRRVRESQNEASRSERLQKEIAEQVHILQQKQKLALEKLESCKSDVTQIAYDTMSEVVDHLEEKNIKLKASLCDLEAKYEEYSNEEKAKEISPDELVNSMIEDQTNVNTELHTYMDKILQTVVEKCPQILEVRSPNKGP